jgi:hypothetical protein
MPTPVPSITLTQNPFRVGRLSGRAPPRRSASGPGCRWEAAPRLATRQVSSLTGRTQEGEEGLDLTHDFAARAIGIEHLVEKAKEGATHRVNLLAAVWAFISLGQKPGGQERAKEEVQVGEALLAQSVDAFA